MSEKNRITKIYPDFLLPIIPVDLAFAIVWLVATIAAIYLPILSETPVRIVLALPTIIFIPGYCLVAALFPKKGDIRIIERIALSFGLSLAVVPLSGLVLNFTPWGIRLDSIVIFLTLFTQIMILLAYYRRALLQSEERFEIRFSVIKDVLSEWIIPSGGSKSDKILSILLTLVILIAIVVTAYVLVVPRESENFTEFYILGENQKAADYPNPIIVGISYPMYIGVGNHEYRSITYTIETWMIQTEFDNLTNTTHIIEMDPQDYLSFTLADNETAIIPYNLSVEKTGYNRVEFLLFNETVPRLEVTGRDRINASYRDLHLEINID